MENYVISFFVAIGETMSYLSVLKTFHALLIICTLVYVFILRRYVPILFTGMIGTTFGIVLVLIAAFILEELLIPKEDKLFSGIRIRVKGSVLPSFGMASDGYQGLSAQFGDGGSMA